MSTAANRDNFGMHSPKLVSPDQHVLLNPKIATLSVVSHGHGNMVKALFDDLSKQANIHQVLILLTLNLAHEEFDTLQFPLLDIKIIRNSTPKGFGANHNAAFTHSVGEWFLIVNPDIRLPDTQTLNHLLSASPQQAVLRAPRVMNSQGELEDAVRRHLTPWSLLRRARGLDREPLAPRQTAERGQPFYWLAGMFLVTQRTVFQKINGFDPRFFLYCEDYDLCARLYISGCRIEIMKNTHVIHDAQRGSHRSWKYLRWHLSSLFKVWFSAAFWKVLWANWWARA
jgi:N-acetylglucosaminyl-diphospho-decaprenol L-rhamnosyltransferase